VVTSFERVASVGVPPEEVLPDDPDDPEEPEEPEEPEDPEDPVDPPLESPEGPRVSSIAADFAHALTAQAAPTVAMRMSTHLTVDRMIAAKTPGAIPVKACAKDPLPMAHRRATVGVERGKAGGL
jgi:hypothetical protein